MISTCNGGRGDTEFISRRERDLRVQKSVIDCNGTDTNARLSWQVSGKECVEAISRRPDAMTVEVKVVRQKLNRDMVGARHLLTSELVAIPRIVPGICGFP